MGIPKELLFDVLALDTETAVLGDHACEIGFSLFRKGELVYEWGTLIKPVVPIEPEASVVNHIYDRDVENSPLFKDIAWHIYNILNSADIHLAYNYEYDRCVLENEFKRVGIKFPLKPMVDPFIFYKQYHKYSKGKTLIKAAGMYGIEYIGAHRAVNDATIAARVMFKMAATKSKFPKDLAALIKNQRLWVELQFKDLRDYFITQGRPEPDEPNYSYFEI
ncbi:hypothetical protein LCGC14_1760530 [marine sediment metagenome]|uniref:Exonuclease domain-containing protein n=1 Tax=marine sediment metagenome TaxID=412755 RepID=A0A0F9JGA7_9ZZZZ